MISTERLDLVPATPNLVRAARNGAPALAAGLRAFVPETWPPEHLDDATLCYLLDRLLEGPAQEGWWLYFVMLRPSDGGRRAVVGIAAYKGPPTSAGTVEVGYSIVSEYQRLGYASEVVRALTARAFEEPVVRSVIGETLPGLAASIGVLEKCGFRFIGEGSEPGIIRYELTRAAYEAAARDPLPVVIRDARPDDAARIAEIHVGAWQHAYRGIVPDAYLDGLSIADRSAIWRARIELPERYLVVAERESDGDVVGWLVGGASRDSDALPRTGEIYALYVDPACWRCGAGRRLWEDARAHFETTGHVAVTLWVLAENHAARRFYEALGFRHDAAAHKTVDLGGHTFVEARYVSDLAH